ncbi:MAG TPA: hypothetical protein VMH91_03080 [Candidatus Paceibacterota bacterium]|nr:hypothetical protein [Candidatus Paceibacterota bacterium]
MNAQGKTGLIIAILALIVVLVGGWYVTTTERAGYTPEHDMMMGTTTHQTVPTTTVMGTQVQNPTEIAQGNSLTIADQPAGTEITVQSLSLSQEGWVAIRDSEGKTLGAALFPPGVQQSVSVPLLRATTAGDTYQALIYFDDGTKTFNLKTETIVLNMDGTVAGTTFTAQK